MVALRFALKQKKCIHPRNITEKQGHLQICLAHISMKDICTYFFVGNDE